MCHAKTTEAKSYILPYKYGKFDLEIYPCTIHVHCLDNMKHLEYRYKINISDSEQYEGFVFEINEGEGIYHIAVRTDTTPDIVAHECKHLVNMIFKYCHLKLDVDNDEAECYLLEWTVKKVYDVINGNKET